MTCPFRSKSLLFTVWAGSPSTLCGSLGRADIWLIRTFWDLETPRPTPPNFQYVGGLHCKPANQLPDDLEAFVQNSGDAGVVVVTFGSMVTNLTTERAEVIAAAFGRIPQKVRNVGKSEFPEKNQQTSRLCLLRLKCSSSHTVLDIIIKLTLTNVMVCLL